MEYKHEDDMKYSHFIRTSRRVVWFNLIGVQEKPADSNFRGRAVNDSADTAPED
jgi:hypothetical protein